MNISLVIRVFEPMGYTAKIQKLFLTLTSSTSPHLPSFHVIRAWLLVGRNSKPNSSHGVSSLADPGVFAGVAKEANLVLRPELDWEGELINPHCCVIDDGLKDSHCGIPITPRKIAGTATRNFISDDGLLWLEGWNFLKTDD